MKNKLIAKSQKKGSEHDKEWQSSHSSLNRDYWFKQAKWIWQRDWGFTTNVFLTACKMDTYFSFIDSRSNFYLKFELYCLNAFDKLHLKHDSFSFILKEIKIGIQE